MPGLPLCRRMRPDPEPMVADASMAAAAPTVDVEPASMKPAPPAKPRRARDEKGRLVADDPKTPDVNEAFEPEAG